jgi:1-acyl-sn-glycerol-3-phosphate acyltransferase
VAERMVAESIVAEDRASFTYRVVMILVTPILRWWGRLQVVGSACIPTSGPLVMIVNHDTAWDPLVVGVAAGRRPVLALARSSLWDMRVLGWVLDRMRQIPIQRGRGDLAAMSAAITRLRQGACIGVFPEGTVSRGRTMRPRSGAGRLVLAVPQTRLLGVSVTGAVDIVRFPRRPRIRVEFFEPSAGGPLPGESAVAITRRMMAEVRERAPYAVPGRRKKAAEFARVASDVASGGRPS